MNKAILVGRLTKDPDVRYRQSGKCVAGFNLAVDRSFGEKKEADFIPIVVWGKVAEVCGNNLVKGQKVLVDGRLQVRNYEDKTGSKRYVTEVIAQTVEFLSYKDDKKPVEPIVQQAQEVFNGEIFPDDVPF